MLQYSLKGEIKAIITDVKVATGDVTVRTTAQLIKLQTAMCDFRSKCFDDSCSCNNLIMQRCYCNRCVMLVSL
jgi:hypothetical protein